jgi:transcriptional regulator with XRE-family HTH domain
MNQNISNASNGSANPAINSVGGVETRSARVRRLYNAPGGALMGWLFDEALARGHQQHELARELGVTVGYLHQLRNGMRQVHNISHDFSKACARYLLVPNIVVKLVSGSIRISDFASPNVSEEELVERAFQRLRTDPVVMAALPERLESLNFEARRALVLLYSEVSCQDLFSMREVPETVRWLQRAVVIHDESEAEALNGHRDVSH